MIIGKLARVRQFAGFSISTIEKSFAKMMGGVIPPLGKPLGAYVPAILYKGQVFTSGQLPLKDGQLMAKGKVGKDVSEETAIECAKWCAFNCLNAARSVIGDLEKIEKVLKVAVFVSSAEGYTNQPKVANGASDVLLELFGEKGKHARCAVGVSELPANAPIEIDMVFGIKE